MWQRHDRDLGGDRMDRKRLRRRCEQQVRALDMPEPFDVRALCERIGRVRGRVIHLLPLAMPTGGPCGLWISTRTAEYVLYEERTSPLHQEHIVLHELGHLLCEHEAAPVLGEDASRLLLPHLDPRMVARVLGRTHYTAEEEQEAEMIASMILQRARRGGPAPAPPAGAVPPEEAGVVARIESSLEHTTAE
nr:hypothetical protein GCM10020241_24150 [Streptoalloteichus tenebrarius]